MCECLMWLTKVFARDRLEKGVQESTVVDPCQHCSLDCHFDNPETCPFRSPPEQPVFDND